ncbi:MAG: hypothetical protein AAFZ07_19640 [Actinomycetota bacterium]
MTIDDTQYEPRLVMRDVGDAREWVTLRDTGLLWAINRYLLHPRGFAFALTYPDGTTPDDVLAGAEPDGWTLRGDGTSPVVYDPRLGEAESFERFEAFLDTHRPDPHEDE